MAVNLGIIGYGGIAFWHAEHAAKIEGVNVIGAYDIDQERLIQAENDGLRTYETLEALLSDRTINTVLVATPNHVHKELVVKSLYAKKHVICEKPVAMNVSELEEMMEAAKINNRLFTVHQNRRWDSDFLVVKKVLEENQLGELFTVQSKLYGSGGLVHGWRAFPEYGGGMLLDWGVHFIDQFLQLIPHKVSSVYCNLQSVKNEEVDDFFQVYIKFENGLLAVTELGTFCLKENPRWFVAGDKGTLVVDDFSGAGSVTKVTKLAEKVKPVIVQTAAGPTRTFAPQPPETKETIPTPEIIGDWTEFYKNIRDVIDHDAELIVKPEEVKRVLQIIDAAFESAHSGRTIELNI